jgi:signal transduction histidine kinase/ligand-binding sensor domain-containing protein
MNCFTSSRILILLSAILLCGRMHAQYYFYKLTEENGLSDNRVTCFLKDKTGFLWIGTKNGLNRYNGTSFKVFRPSAGNSISSEVINDIVQDNQGRIWVATMSGLNIYDPTSDRWETMMPASTDVKTDLPNYLIWDLCVDEKNRIWIVSDVWELSVIDPLTRKITYYNWPSVWEEQRFATAPLYKSIQKIERKSENEWWLGTTIGLFSVNIQSGGFQFYGAGSTGSIRDLKYDKVHGKVFTVSENGQLFCYEEKTQRYYPLNIDQQVYPARTWSKNKTGADLLLMSHPEGLLELDTRTQKATVIKHQQSLTATLSPGGTNNIYADGGGMTWVGTSNGINYFSNQNRLADFIPLTIASEKNAEDGMSAAFYDSTGGRYYIASIQTHELFIIDDRTGNISSIQSAEDRQLSGCTNICVDNHNNIWLLTETNVYRYDKNKMKLSLFRTPNNDKPVIFHDFLEDRNGDYWFATFQDGVYHYKTKEKKFYSYYVKDGFYSKSVTALKNDPVENAIWLGTYNYGLFRYTPDSNLFINSGHMRDSNYDQLNLIRDIETDATRKLWVSTFVSGLYFCVGCKTFKKSFNHLTIKEGLTHNGYLSIAADSKNRMWLLGEKGLSVIDQSGNFMYDVKKHPVLAFSNYAPDVSYPKRIFFNSKKNELLVPVSGGLMLYYPDQDIPAAQFPVVLTDIIVDGKSILFDSSHLTTGSIDIPYKSNSLSFRFAALNYANREGMQYEYKLHESDKEWKSLGNSNAANFPDIASGRYTFLIRAKDSNGNLSANVASFSFNILPPFWKTWWFLLLMVWAAGAIVYIIYRYQLNKKLEVERIRLRIARDLHDDIGSALTSINVLSKVALSKGSDQRELSGYLSKIKDSTMITMESMSDIVWAINPKNDKLEALVSRMKEFVVDICEAQGIELNFLLPAELEKVSLDLSKRKNLFLIFKEAVNNAVKYSYCSLLHIEFEKTGHKLRMMIKDNGNGFDQSVTTQGNGLVNMKDRATECSGVLHIESSGNGTSIILEMPLTRFGILANR